MNCFRSSRPFLGSSTPLRGEMGLLNSTPSPGLDVRPEVARAVVNAGFDLLDMHAATFSLEDIFLQLTRDEPTAPSLQEPPVVETVEEG